MALARLMRQHAWPTALAFYILSAITSQYLQWQPVWLTRIVLFIFLLCSYRFRSAKSNLILSFNVRIAYGFFSLLFAVATVLGNHIVLEQNDGYNGLASENYISPYELLDVFALIAIWITAYLVSSSLFLIVQRYHSSSSAARHSYRFEPVDLHFWGTVSLLLFVLYIPWLLAYWPGFIFSDTLSSVAQALGEAQLTNHHPVLYTLMIRACIALAEAFGFGATTGLALMNIMQMAFMATILGHFSAWLSSRFCIKKVWCLIPVIAFGCMPYFATYSIAMWKDPIFIACFVHLSLMLTDVAFATRPIITPQWILRFTLFSLLAMLMRNNGVYIIILIVLSFVALSAASRRAISWVTTAFRIGSRPCIAAGTVALLIYLAITGPGFTALGVKPSEKVESLGIPLNQMARVAALQGNMSDSDRAYMNTLLPLELYPTTYRPCCTDLLKWNTNFNGNALGDDFLQHWLSMLVRNPRVFFEAWELQTFGFWAPNAGLDNFSNIGGGVPRNLYHQEDLAAYDLSEDNLLHSSIARDLLPTDEAAICVGLLFWIIGFCTITLVLRRGPSELLPFLPSLGLLATLLIASPIYYWPRYGALLQFLVPFYFILTIFPRLEFTKGVEAAV